MLDALIILGFGYLLYAVIPMPFSVIVMAVILAFFVLSLTGLVNMFIIWPVLKPHVVSESKEVSQDVEVLFSDEITTETKEEE